MLDLLVKGGLVVDGSGLPPYRADLGVADGTIVRIGQIDEPAAVRVDASSRAVAPGFIDIHTHFDAQLSWDPQVTPLLEHGVTTVVTGNCSLSLAPLRSHQRARLSRMFGQIEQLPQALFEQGVDWSWETFGEWLEARRGRLGANLAPLVGHSSLRMFVMGDDAHERAATAGEIAAMQSELRASLAAGGVGLSVSCVDVDEKGRPVPSRLAEPREIDALAEVLGQHGAILQIVPEYYDASKLCERIDELATRSLRYGLATTFSPLIDQTPGLVDAALERLDRVIDSGARVYAQVQPRGFDVNFRLDEWNFVLYRCSGWSRILRLGDHGEQLDCYRDPDTRAKLVGTAYPVDNPAQRAQLDQAYVSAVGKASLHEYVGRSLGDIGRSAGVNPAEAMLDLAIRAELDIRFTKPPSSNVDHELLSRMLAHRAVLVGASDAGAHVRGFSTYGDTSLLFSRWVAAGEMRLETAVKRLTSDLATAWSLPRRGAIRRGAAADLVVFDPASFGWGPEADVADLPAGCRRYVRGSTGVDATVVNGQVAWSAAQGYSSALSGMLATDDRG